MKKLILFGDSLIKNINKPMSVEIEDQAGVDLYNCAVGGWDTTDGVRKAPYISSLSPDIILFSFGTNDAAPWKSVEEEDFKQNIEKIFETFGLAKKIFFLPPPLNEERQTGENKRLNTMQKNYAEIARGICDQNGVRIMDSWEIFQPMLASGRDYHDEDGVHFNDLGNQILVSEIIKAVKD